MQMHPTTSTLATVVAIVTLLANLVLGYFNIPNAIACDLTAAAPEMQAAAAAAIGR